ncbi:hypothetical protein JS532_05340 [Bifidobacterium callimiconis]|uniref:hypothetical protein n=1 Tax=Bifidobacterium callimiconis TaxID=2306973 RepID=UPI001BDD8AC4|nr:hypothetical protein [Bifidobacterium callimiconis]MBT1176995.1 hypothetical protein [Bifidobacterium callimiconis]
MGCTTMILANQNTDNPARQNVHATINEDNSITIWCGEHRISSTVITLSPKDATDLWTAWLANTADDNGKE